MSRKKILASLIISSFALTACDSEDLPIKENENFSYSRLQFNPTGGQLPKPNDLLFASTVKLPNGNALAPDGTLQLPDEIKAVAASGATTTYADNTIAIGALDGWSTTHPLVMDVDLLDGRTIAAGAGGVLPSTAVRIFPVTLNGPLSTDAANCSTDSKISLTVCNNNGELTYGSDFVTKITDDGADDGKGTIAIIWLKPLPAKSSFLYAFTDVIKDSSGKTIRGSKTYEFVKQDQATTPAGKAESSTRTVQGLMNNYDSTLSEVAAIPNGNPLDGKLDPANVTFTGVFTTQDHNEVMNTTQQIALGTVLATRAAGHGAIPVSNMKMPLTSNITKNDVGAVHTAQLALPYYLSNKNSSSYWSAKGDSLLSLGAKLLGGALTDDDFTTCGTTSAAVGTDYKKLAGCDLGGDIFKHLTRFNPIPKVESQEIIDVQITIPTGYDGKKVNIAVHGLGSLKETTLGTAAELAKQGIATIAIDMPLHGSRGFDLDVPDGIFDISATDTGYATAVSSAVTALYKPGFDPSASTANATYQAEYVNKFSKGTPLAFINVNSGLTVRDNFRQGIIDLLTLRLRIADFEYIDSTKVFSNPEVSIHGLSLGAITATTVAAYANNTELMSNLPSPLNTKKFSDEFGMSKISLVAPTGGLAWVFNESPTFGPLLMDQLVAIVAKDQGIPFALPTDPVQLNAARQSAGYKALEAAADEKIVPSLLFSVQTQVDSIDPINMAEMLSKNSENKLHLIEIVGDGSSDGNLSDQVLPNKGTVPVTGTEALIENLKLDTRIDDDSKCLFAANDYVNGGVVRFSQGHHSSLINPASAAGATDAGALGAYVEMNTQVATFAGADLTVTNSGILSTTCN